MTLTYWFVRHPESTRNLANKILKKKSSTEAHKILLQDNKTAEITETGERAKNATIEWFNVQKEKKSGDSWLVITSPYDRCRVMAEEISKKLNADLVIQPDISEHCLWPKQRTFDPKNYGNEYKYNKKNLNLIVVTHSSMIKKAVLTLCKKFLPVVKNCQVVSFEKNSKNLALHNDNVMKTDVDFNLFPYLKEQRSHMLHCY